MALFNRLLALALGLLLLVGGAGAAALALGWIAPLQSPSGYLIPSITDQSDLYRYWLGGGGGVLAVLGLMLVFFEARGSSRDGDLLLQESRGGRVSVSLTGLARLAEHVIGEISGIESVISSVRPTREGLLFQCRILVAPDGSVPQLSEEMRRRLEETIGHHLGQPASRIHLHTRVTGTALSRKRVQ